MELKVSSDRIKKDIEIIGTLSRDDERGRTCFSYSDLDMAVRSYLMDQMADLGMEVSVDGVGNVRGRLPGRTELPSVLSGSHVDSVFQGGDYDGVVGVVAALEVARCLAKRDNPLKRPYEVVIFSEEEGSNFGVTCAGSKAMTGYLSLEDVKKLLSQSEMSMYDMCSFKR
ncbi:MAG: M20/M25/M40 family metallo-hydrolase [Synergistales bacterium]|nr:M20/M25/M40 family metallo-hydrolase [Synergistales bacterium]